MALTHLALTTAVALCLLLASAGLLAAEAPPGANLVRNPGFEEGGTGWSLPGSLYTVEQDAGHGSKCSLCYRNRPGGPYLLATQAVPLRAGKSYRISAWVKTLDIVSSDTGAGICLEWSGGGGYIGGAYPPGYSGTGHWRRIDYYTGALPASVTGGGIVLYGRPGTSGTAWFDDVEVVENASTGCEIGFAQRSRKQLAPTAVVRPGGPPPILEARLAAESPLDPVDLTLSAAVDMPGGGKLEAAGPTRWQGRMARADVRTDGIYPGRSSVQATLVSGRGGRPVAGESLTLDLRAPTPPRPRTFAMAGRASGKAAVPANATWFDRQGMLRVAGKPFFPIGFYILSSFESVFPVDRPYRWLTGELHPTYYLPILDRLAKSHFNCVIDYGSTMGGIDQARAFMDAAHAHGIHTIFSIKDLMKGAYWEAYTARLPWKDLIVASTEVVRGLRDHPSLIAWYINDEVIQPSLWQGAVDVYRIAGEQDPWHPRYAVHYDAGHIARYREACDVIGTDPYTLLGDIGAAAQSWRWCREQTPKWQPNWAVVQCFGPGYETSNPAEKREPSYDEERSATLAAIAEGATGIIYYCYHSLERSPRFAERFAELDLIAAEVQGLVPMLCLPDAPRPAKVESGQASVLAKRGHDATRILVVSTSRADQEVRLRLPFRPRSVRDEKTGEELRAAGDRLLLKLRALDARVLLAR